MTARSHDGTARQGHHDRLGVPSNLPAELSSFVGRRGDLERGVALLGSTRLLTLTGAGGCGKTRLAGRLAARVAGRYSDGVWWVELAALTEGALVAESLARAVGIVGTGEAAADAVIRRLGGTRSLVVLDNCEHLLDPVAALTTRLLAQAPDVHVLCTSRHPVGVDGETTWRVPSMALPPLTGEPGAVRAFDASALFLTRATQADPDLVLTPATAGSITRICQRLDGMPLAIELAAARVRSLPLDRIASGLDDRFRLLSGGSRAATERHRTLRASVEWSHDQLDGVERALLRRLAVFVGGFTADAADEVVAFGPLPHAMVLDVLARLVDHSLVQLDASGRYRLLETIRAYARDSLHSAGEERAVADRHLEWAAAFAERLEPATFRSHQHALDALETELPNLRAALDHAATAPPPTHGGLRLVASLPLFWGHRGWAIEGMTRAAPVRAADPGAPAALQSAAHWAAAYTHHYSGTDFPGALVEARAALEAATAQGDLALQARAWWLVAVAEVFVNGPVAGREAALRGVAVAKAAADLCSEGTSSGLVALTHLTQYHLAATAEARAAALAASTRADDVWGITWGQYYRGALDAARGNYRDARAALASGVDMARRVGDPVQETFGVAALTVVALATGQWAEISRIADGMGRSGRGVEPTVHESLIAALHAIAAIGDEPVEAATVLARTGEWLITAVDAVSGQRLLLQGATALLAAGDADRAGAAATTALAICTHLGSALVGPCRVLLARLDRGADPGAAERGVHTDLVTTLDVGLVGDVPDALELLGGLAVDTGHPAEGARLLAAALAQNTALGRHRWFAATADADRDRAADALGADFDRIWAEGTAMDAPSAIAYARRARGERGRPAFGWDALTPTERQVVALVAAGLSNPAIAERMFIARSTVKTHLLHVFAKLGVANRTELAAAAARRGGSDD